MENICHLAIEMRPTATAGGHDGRRDDARKAVHRQHRRGGVGCGELRRE